MRQDLGSVLGGGVTERGPSEALTHLGLLAAAFSHRGTRVNRIGSCLR